MHQITWFSSSHFIKSFWILFQSGLYESELFLQPLFCGIDSEGSFIFTKKVGTGKLSPKNVLSFFVAENPGSIDSYDFYEFFFVL